MESTLRIGKLSIPYTVEKKRRKTIGIRISEEKGVLVSIPQWATRKQVDEVLAQKADWICAKYELVLQRRAVLDSRSYTQGSPVLYLGTEYPLSLEYGKLQNRARLTFKDGKVQIELPAFAETGDASKREAYIKSVLEGWYKHQAASYLAARLAVYAEKMGVKPLKLSIRGQKKRWGSCSAKNSIQLNWKLMLAPEPVLDYVIVHELAHIREKNHSKAFWRLVEAVLPDYRQRQAWLKENGYRLMV